LSRILVTGAAGFIGSHLVERLLEVGHEVVGVDAFTGYYSRRRKERNLAQVAGEEGFHLVRGDLLDLELDGLLRGMDGVAHLAAESGVRASWGDDFPRYLERNVEATQRLLEALSGRSVERFVFASSSSVYGSVDGPVKETARLRPASPYGLSKLAAEELVGLYARQRGVPATVLRYFTVYGPRQRPDMALARFISAAARGEPLRVFGDGSQTREMTYVSDVVDATVAALEAPPEASTTWAAAPAPRWTSSWATSGAPWTCGSRSSTGPPPRGTYSRRGPTWSWWGGIWVTGRGWGWREGLRPTWSGRGKGSLPPDGSAAWPEGRHDDRR